VASAALGEIGIQAGFARRAPAVRPGSARRLYAAAGYRAIGVVLVKSVRDA
jgi:hypothetical protein